MFSTSFEAILSSEIDLKKHYILPVVYTIWIVNNESQGSSFQYIESPLKSSSELKDFSNKPNSSFFIFHILKSQLSLSKCLTKLFGKRYQLLQFAALASFMNHCRLFDTKLKIKYVD